MSVPPPNRRRFLTVLGVAGASVAAATGGDLVRRPPATAAIPGPTSYTPEWASVDQHPPAPEWFQDAKFGIYFHWGVFCVPAFDSEWYPRNMHLPGSRANQHHTDVYGTPAEWPYHNFLDGAADKAGGFVQFAPKLRSAGGAFDPDEWAQLFADAGAKFAGPVAEHHDGISLWDSAVNEWNSVQRGPRLNLVRLHADAIRAKGLKLMVAMHHAYNSTGYFEHVPTQPTYSLRKLYGQLGPDAQNRLWLDKLQEVVDRFQPDILWQDFNLDAIDETRRLEFLAHYYNRAVQWDKEVVATYKDGYNDRGEVFDYERGGPAEIRTPYWMTDDSISSSSWCYTAGIGYYSLPAMVHSLVDRVSKNGTVVLNIAPTPAGTIPDQQRSILLGIGDYLKRFGESVYATRAWTAYGEGPTKMGGGSFTTPVAGTAADIRFTRDKADRTLYATVLGWPGGVLHVTTLAAGRIDLGTLTSVRLLGPTAGASIDLPTRHQDGSGLHITMPSSAAPFTAPAYVVKLTFSGPIPTLRDHALPTGWVRLNNVTSGLVLDSGGTVAPGSRLKQWAWDGSPNLQWKVVDLGTGYHRLVNRTNGLDADSRGDRTDGAVAKQSTWTGGVDQQWRFVHLGGGRFQIVNRGTGTALDGEGRWSSGASAILWTPNAHTNNHWTITAL